MDRVRSKRSADEVKPKNTDNLTAEQQQLIKEVDQRRSKQKRKSSTDAS